MDATVIWLMSRVTSFSCESERSAMSGVLPGAAAAAAAEPEAESDSDPGVAAEVREGRGGVIDRPSGSWLSRPAYFLEPDETGLLLPPPMPGTGGGVSCPWMRSMTGLPLPTLSMAISINCASLTISASSNASRLLKIIHFWSRSALTLASLRRSCFWIRSAANSSLGV